MPGPGRKFKKGESGNPGGRPKVLAELRDLARSHALATKGRSEKARIAAIHELLDRGYGKSTQYVADHEEPATEN